MSDELTRLEQRIDLERAELMATVRELAFRADVKTRVRNSMRAHPGRAAAAVTAAVALVSGLVYVISRHNHAKD